ISAVADTAPPAQADEQLIPALDIISVDDKYLPLCRILLRNVYVLNTEDERALDSGLPAEAIVILHKSGKFSKNMLGLAGGSVGLFEGKRIGRAKNLENLAKEIKSLGQHIAKQQAARDDATQQLASLKGSSRKADMEELDRQLNRLNNELVSVKTKQEQYEAFITNSRNRKQDIEQKMARIAADLREAEPRLEALNAAKITSGAELHEMQVAYQELSDVLTDKSSAFNQENIRFHQQQNAVSSVTKDLEYRASLRETYEGRITKNAAEYEQVQSAIKDTQQHVDEPDEDLVAMYTQKEAYEKGLQEAEEDYYTSRGKINEKEEELAQLRRQKEQVDFLFDELRDKKTTLKLDLNALKERLAVEFSIDIDEIAPPADGDADNANAPQDDEDTLRQKTEKLRRQLDDFGSINPMAMEAYQEMRSEERRVGKERRTRWA